MLREIYPCVHVIILVYIDHVFLDKSDIIIINICKVNLYVLFQGVYGNFNYLA